MPPAGAAVRIRIGAELRLDDIGPGIKELTGHDRASLLADDRRFWRLVHPDDRQALRSALGASRESTFPLRFRMVHRDQGAREIELVTVAAAEDDTGELLVDGLLLDASQGTTVERRVAGLVTVLVEDLHGTIHTIVVGAATVARFDAELSVEQRAETLRTIERAGHRLDEVSGRLGELARWHRDPPLEPTRVAALALVRRAVGVVRVPANLSLEIGGDGSLEVDVHEGGMVQAIAELLRNAVRHGGDRVSVEVGANATHIVIAVEDNGRGIPVDLQPHLFEPFSRRRDRYGELGPGLGLPIAQAIVRRCGGILRHRPGRISGATFTVSLPVAGAPRGRVASAPPPLRVIVLAADGLSGEALAVALRGSPRIAEAVSSADVAEVLSVVDRPSPDVAVIDLDLPPGVATEAAVALRGVWPSLRVLLIGSRPTLDDLDTAMDAGVAGLLPKERGLWPTVAAVHRLPHQDVFVDRADLIALHRSRSAAPVPQLTEREHDVLRLLAQGRSPSRIARDLDLQLSTCRGYVKSILGKLGVHTQLEAVVTAYRLGLVSPGGPGPGRGEQARDDD